MPHGICWFLAILSRFAYVKGTRTSEAYLSASRPAATDQQSLVEQNDSTQALREDILNLRAAMRTETPDNETQASASSRTEGKKDQYAAQAEREESEYNAVFRDIEVVKDLPIWAEPITMSTSLGCTKLPKSPGYWHKVL